MKLSALAAQIKNCGHCEVSTTAAEFLSARGVPFTAWMDTPEHRTRESWELCWAFRRRR